MKIGLLTYHRGYNFGANLQALSTVEYLKRQGHEPVVIDFYPRDLESRYDRSKPERQAEAHKAFAARHYAMTSRCENSRQVAEQIVLHQIEAVVIGSDAVLQHWPWITRATLYPSKQTLVRLKTRPLTYENNYPNPFWGDFLNFLEQDLPVAVLSASCENTDFFFIRGRHRREMGNLLQRFKYISVRDERTLKLVKHLTRGAIVPPVTPDPVFALNTNVSSLPARADILKKFSLPAKYLLFSFHSSRAVSREWLSDFRQLASNQGLTCVALAMPEGIVFDHPFERVVDVPLDPLDWYSVIRFSAGYIGDNMHPIIVCLHNSVPCYSFDHYGRPHFHVYVDHRSSKIAQILNRANLSSYRTSIAGRFNVRRPSPDFVMDKIQSYSRDLAVDFSNQMQHAYDENMQHIMNTIGAQVIVSS